MKTHLLCLTFFVLIFSNNLFAQAGTPDKKFGDKGVATIPVPLFENETTVWADYITQDNNGKLLVAARSYGSLSQHAFIYRLTTNGRVDSSFGINGRIFINNAVSFYDLLVDSAGKIFVGVGTGDKYGIAITRLKKNGSIDSAFGINGSFRSTFGYDSVVPSPRSLTLLPSGKMLASVRYFPTDLYDSALATIVFQLNKNGTIDSSFNGSGYNSITSNGIAFTSYNSTYNTGKTLIALPNNKIVFELSATVLAELNRAGKRNFNFGNDGVIEGKTGTFQGITYQEQLWDLHPLSNGGFMCLGSFEEDDYEGGGYYSSSVYQFKKNGTRDSSFNGTGAVTIQPNYGFFEFPDRTENLTVQPDGKFLVTKETSESGTNHEQKITRYLATGEIDSAFGKKGSINFGAYNYPFLTQLLLQNDLKLVTLANTSLKNGDTGFFYVFRYNNDAGTLNAKSSDPSNLINANNKSASHIIIAPNPVQNVLRIYGLESGIKLSIINESGRVVGEANTLANNYSWNIQTLPAGNYFLVAMQNNQIITSIKFIKQ